MEGAAGPRWRRPATGGQGVNHAGTGTLWLHVGTHKTGTTSIQRALQLSAARLRAAGVAVHPEAIAWALTNTFLRPEIRSTPRGNYGEPLPDLARLAAVPAKIAAARGTAPEMVISSKEFCLLHTPLEAFALKSALAPAFARINCARPATGRPRRRCPTIKAPMAPGITTPRRSWPSGRGSARRWCWITTGSAPKRATSCPPSRGRSVSRVCSTGSTCVSTLGSGA